MKKAIDSALETLKSGGIILYPTDTIWGIGCDATNTEAVEKIFRIKQREDSKSMLLLVDNECKISSYVDSVPEIAYDLIELSDKPLTIIYSGAKNISDKLIAEDNSIGIRVTKEEFSNTLCKRFKKPIVSTSANISGEPSPGSFNDISEEIKNSVDYIVEYNQEINIKQVPSGIIKLGNDGTIKIIRK